MPALPFKYSLSIVLFVLLIFTFFLTAWQLPMVGITLGLIVLVFGFVATSYTIIQKNRKAYRLGKSSLPVCIKNICLEIAAILLALVLAGVIGRSLSIIATGNMTSYPVKLLTGIGIGIVVGWAVGLCIKFASSRLIKTSPGS